MIAPTEGAFRLIPLTRGLHAVVDADMFDWLNQWKWQALRSRNTFYAKRTERSNGLQWGVTMHREILGVPTSVLVDHRDRNGLHNFRSNLREATPSQNSTNKTYRLARSGYRGVHQQKSGRWKATACLAGKRMCAGTFDTPLQAALAYDAMAREAFGAFAVTNFQTAD